MIKQGKDVGSESNAWMNEAACKDWDFKKCGDPFYPASTSLAAAEEALVICDGCPVRKACRGWGQADPKSRTSGIFGGTLPEERIRTARREDRKRRQRQTKEEAKS